MQAGSEMDKQRPFSFNGQRYIEENSSEKNIYNVYVGEGWYELEFEQRGDILKNMSRSREIMGHSPLLKMFDLDSGKSVAAVKKESIQIKFRDEGFFEYIAHGEKPEQTLY